jgi:acetyltransferase-like isoleucine patch superfamily enzyme
VKELVDFIALWSTLPAYAAYRVGAGLLGPQKAFAGWSELFSLVPGLTGIYLRRGFYRWALAGCGEGACISFGTLISHPTARIGCRVYVGPFGSLGDVTLEDDVLLGSHVSVMNGSEQHGIERLDIPIREQPGRWPHVTIGRDTWIGDRAIVMADVGQHCVIGAGTLVTRPIPDYAVAVGVPARVVRFRGGDHERNEKDEMGGGSEGNPLAVGL